MWFKKIIAIHSKPQVTGAQGEVSIVYLSAPCFLYFVVVVQSTIVIITVVVITLVIIPVVIVLVVIIVTV